MGPLDNQKGSLGMIKTSVFPSTRRPLFDLVLLNNCELFLKIIHMPLGKYNLGVGSNGELLVKRGSAHISDNAVKKLSEVFHSLLSISLAYPIIEKNLLNSIPLVKAFLKHHSNLIDTRLSLFFDLDMSLLNAKYEKWTETDRFRFDCKKLLLIGLVPLGDYDLSVGSNGELCIERGSGKISDSAAEKLPVVLSYLPKMFSGHRIAIGWLFGVLPRVQLFFSTCWRLDLFFSFGNFMQELRMHNDISSELFFTFERAIQLLGIRQEPSEVNDTHPFPLVKPFSIDATLINDSRELLDIVQMPLGHFDLNIRSSGKLCIERGSGKINPTAVERLANVLDELPLICFSDPILEAKFSVLRLRIVGFLCHAGCVELSKNFITEIQRLYHLGTKSPQPKPIGEDGIDNFKQFLELVTMPIGQYFLKIERNGIFSIRPGESPFDARVVEKLIEIFNSLEAILNFDPRLKPIFEKMSMSIVDFLSKSMQHELFRAFTKAMARLNKNPETNVASVEPNLRNDCKQLLMIAQMPPGDYDLDMSSSEQLCIKSGSGKISSNAAKRLEKVINEIIDMGSSDPTMKTCLLQMAPVIFHFFSRCSRPELTSHFKNAMHRFNILRDMEGVEIGMRVVELVFYASRQFLRTIPQSPNGFMISDRFSTDEEDLVVKRHLDEFRSLHNCLVAFKEQAFGQDSKSYIMRKYKAFESVRLLLNASRHREHSSVTFSQLVLAIEQLELNEDFEIIKQKFLAFLRAHKDHVNFYGEEATKFGINLFKIYQGCEAATHDRTDYFADHEPLIVNLFVKAGESDNNDLLGLLNLTENIVHYDEMLDYFCTIEQKRELVNALPEIVARHFNLEYE